MSALSDYIAEKEEIDALISEGFTISNIAEHIDGDTVTWTFRHEHVVAQREMMLGTADARKYLGVVLIEQLRLNAMNG